MIYRILFCFMFLITSASANWEMLINKGLYVILAGQEGFLLNNESCEIEYYLDMNLKGQNLYFDNIETLYYQTTKALINTYYIQDAKILSDKLLSNNTIKIQNSDKDLLKVLDLQGFNKRYEELQRSCKLS